jgi:hypothetical protein
MIIQQHAFKHMKGCTKESILCEESRTKVDSSVPFPREDVDVEERIGEAMRRTEDFIE